MPQPITQPRWRFLFAWFAPTFAVLSLLAGPRVLAQASSVAINGEHFLIDGQPVQIISGEMHYPRIPHEYWHERLVMAKAMGLNTIQTYVFWNVHEPSPGVFDFSGDHDVAGFIREAQSVGLNVILRPGPYVCAEWEFGGLPYWLLKDRRINLRSGDPKFMDPVRSWFTRLGQELAPLQHAHGGPIIAVQIENEYGSFGSDTNYLASVQAALKDAGFDESVMFTSNPPDDAADGSLNGVATAVNFGPGDAETAFKTLRALRPGGFMMAGEYWAGWFDDWGSPHHGGHLDNETNDLTWMLRQGYSVNLYMFNGGTNFGWMNGATVGDHGEYLPITTSYGYDAALDESGRTTPKFDAFRRAIAQVTGHQPIEVPEVAPTIALAPFKITHSVSLWDTLPTPVLSEKPLTMEDLDQPYGYILYRTHVSRTAEAELSIQDLHGFAHVYLDGHFIGALDRRHHKPALRFAVTAPSARLDILVENTGRLNYSTAISGERMGITKRVLYAGRELRGWKIYSLPLAPQTPLALAHRACTGPCLFEGEFEVNDVGDTFLDMSDWYKGEVWVNGHALGRFWEIGPQKTLYLPGAWLKSGKNTIRVFDLKGYHSHTIQGLTAPTSGRLK